MQNIGGDSRDANYRYKMPVLVTKVEGRGNGIKTVVVNMVDIAKSLHIHPAYPTKFFGIELGAQSKFNVATERAIVNGCHQAGDLAKLLDKFIQQFILCPNCRLPELKMTIKAASIKYECAACGAAGQIKSGHRLIGYMTKNPPKSFEEGKTGGDKDEKKKKKDKKKKDGSDDEADDGLDEASAAVVAAASSSALPAGDAEAEAGGEKEKEKKPKKTKEEKEAKKARKEAKKAKKAKKEEKKAKKAKKADKDEKDSSASESSDDEEESKEETAAAAKEEKKEKKAAAASSSPKDEDAEDDEEEAEDDADEDEDEDEDEDGDDDWHTDTSKAAVKRRAEAEFAEMLNGATRNVESIVLAAKADNKADSPVTVLKIFLASATRSPGEVAAELRRLAMARGLDEAQKIKVLLEALIDTSQPKTVLEQLKKHATLLQYFTTGAGGASSSGVSSPDARTSNAAVTMLTCVEDLVGVVERKLLPYTGHILKTLYESDVLPEETLLAWWDAPPESSWLVNKEVAAEVRAKAAPFIQALREADEEEEEEDEE